MSRLSGAFVAFVVVFACVFVLSRQYVTPHLPSTGDISAAMNDPAFWTANWAGVVLGSILGLSVASTVLRKRKRKKA
jgi:hypothetical protein